MSKETQGLVVKVTEGNHKGKKGYAYHVNQYKETQEKGYAVIIFSGDEKKYLIEQGYCKVIGYCD